jgi:hypothetical protein
MGQGIEKRSTNIFRNDATREVDTAKLIATLGLQCAPPKKAGAHQKPAVTERRRSPRVEHSTEVALLRLSGKPLSQGSSIDVSMTGIKLSTADSLSVGSALQLVLTMPGSRDKTTINGIVVWNKPTHQMFEAGIMFATEADLAIPKSKSNQTSKPAGYIAKPGS